jgi:alpha-glucosidase
VTLDSLPLFVREGAFIFRQPVVQHTGEMSGKPLRVLAVPARQSETVFYEDDGESFDYRGGGYLKRRFRQIRENSSVMIEVTEPDGSYRPAPRDLIFEAWLDWEPQTVSVRYGQDPALAAPLPRLDRAALEKSLRGWSYEDGAVVVKDNDRFSAERIAIER